MVQVTKLGLYGGSRGVVPAAEQVFASGTPSVTKPTSTGNVELTRFASGAPQVTKPTSLGDVVVRRIASGAPQVTKPTSTGFALVPTEGGGVGGGIAIHIASGF